MPGKERTNQIIQSLDRGLGILDYLANKDEDVSLNELTSHLNIDKSSTFRLLATLVRRGYVRQNQQTKKYSLGYRIFDLSSSLAARFKLEEAASPFLRELTRRTGESAHLGVHLQGKVTFISRERCRDVLGINTELGRREPLHCTALGKVLLAYFTEEELEDFLQKERLERFATNTIISVNKLKKELQNTRTNGYALDDEEYRIGVRCIASPVYNAEAKVIAALGISGPSSRLTEKRLPKLCTIVKGIADELSQSLGFSFKKERRK